MVYLRPTNLPDALSHLGPDTVIAAGCTDLFPATERPRLAGRILDITAIAGLRGISRSARGLRIGAATTWAELLHAELPLGCAGLRAAAREVGSVQIQSAATVVGNLCNASPAADGVPPLLTLGAEVELTGPKGIRHLPVSRFIRGPRKTARRPGEIVTAVILTETEGSGGFHKLGARRYLVISVVMAAVRLLRDGDRIADVKLALGACSPTAVRLPELEVQLRGLTLTQAASRIRQADLPISPIDDIRADARYRRHAATVSLLRALEAAA